MIDEKSFERVDYRPTARQAVKFYVTAAVGLLLHVIFHHLKYTGLYWGIFLVKKNQIFDVFICGTFLVKPEKGAFFFFLLRLSGKS